MLLPPNPNLEYERKQAKELLRALRTGDPDAIARATAQKRALETAQTGDIVLADAQFIIAREYGFASWPRLVRYFQDVERQQKSRSRFELHDASFYESSVTALISHHHNRRPFAGRSLAASIPRFYGKKIAAVFASRVDEDDARLTVARQSGYPSWQVLMEAVTAQRIHHSDPWQRALEPLKVAGKAIRGGDLTALRALVADYPRLLRPGSEERRRGQSIVAMTLDAEERDGPNARAMTDWLSSQGADVATALNERLLYRMFPTTSSVRFNLERGADPNWIAPNGIPVLEHALLLYWNGDAVDLIAERVSPGKALWIAAGLGDVNGVRQFLDRNGNPTTDAYRHRPDFSATGGRMPMLSHPAADGIEILAEAFLVAMLNDRITVLDCLIDRGFPIDYLGYESPFVSFAVGNQRLRVVECLVRRGANLDLKGRQPDMSAREMARERFENAPNDSTARRILELCGGGDPDVLSSAFNSRPAPEPEFAPGLHRDIQLASDDAARQGHAEIGPDSLFIGMLRSEGCFAMEVLRTAAVDVAKLAAMVGSRVLPAIDTLDGGERPWGAEAHSIMIAATDSVRQRRGDVVTAIDVLSAMCARNEEFLSNLLDRCGSSMPRLGAVLAQFTT